MAVVGLMIVALPLAGCSGPWDSTPTPEPHAAYSYGKLSTIDPSIDVHPGDAITFTWEASSEGVVHARQPNQIALHAGLYGPFDTVDALKTQMSSGQPQGHAIGSDLSGAVVQITPVKTDSWTNETYTSTMNLPPSLPPGFYSLVRVTMTTAGNVTTTSESQTVLRVVAS